MTLHYRVRSVLLSDNATALTLSPGTWHKDSATETETDPTTGETYPAWEDCEPTDNGAEFFDEGGKMTELRIPGTVGWVPGDLLTVRVGESV